MFLKPFPRTEKKIPWPVDEDVEVTFNNWKYPKKGRFQKSDDPNVGGYGFYYDDPRTKKQTYRQCFVGYDPIKVYTMNPRQEWNCYQ